MKIRNVILILAAFAAGVVGTLAFARQDDSMGEEHQAPPITSHHKKIHAIEGTWETSMKMWTSPEMPPMEMPGTATYTKGPGEYWMTGVFKSNFGGQAFEGREIIGFDSVKNKHVSIWIDSASSHLNVGEGSCDGKCMKESGMIHATGMDGKPMTTRYTGETKDENTFVFDMYQKGPDGKEFHHMSITYKRKK